MYFPIPHAFTTTATARNSLSSGSSAGINTLDLIEDCLNSIYDIRRSNILSKTYPKKSPYAGGGGCEGGGNPTQKLLKQPEEKKEMSVDFKRIHSYDSDDEQADKDKAKGIFKRPKQPKSSSRKAVSFSHTTKPSDTNHPPPSNKSLTKPPAPNTSSIILSPGGNSSLGMDTSSTDEVTKSPNESNMLFKSSSRPTFQMLAGMEDDAKALELLKEFRAELVAWTRTDEGQTKIVAEEARAEVGNYFSEAYLNRRLDPLPASQVVSKVRRDICAIIEDFVRMAKVPSIDDKELIKRMSSKSPSLIAGARVSASYTNLVDTIHTETGVSAVKVDQDDRGIKGKSSVDEKKRMLAQFDSYVKAKGAGAESSQVAAIESTVEDIKSLLSSLSIKK